jgi:hypothetical protein
MTSTRILILLLIICSVKTVNGQLPSNPLPTKEDSLYNIADTLRFVSNHLPGEGFQLISQKGGTLVFSAYASVRYLNQGGLQDSAVNSFGDAYKIQKRNDVQFQKVVLYFKGWLFDPRFRYLLYVWTANTNLGLGAQVVVGGNVQYQVNKYLDLGAGIGALPMMRSLLGQWSGWLRQDARPMAEEFFRGSYTSGIWAQGELAKGFYYKTMLGNNLSQLGVNAGQLDNIYDTWSTMVWWSSAGYGRVAPFGDFGSHERPAYTLGAAFTSSTENRQSQPGSEAPENSQIRLSDGTGIFAINAFKTGANVIDAKYHLFSANGGIKYKGLSFDAEYYNRWVTNFVATGPLPISKLNDQGFALQASGMIIEQTLQAYGAYSYVDGQYGKPSEFSIGLNVFPFKNKSFRINGEYTNTKHSPVGYYSYPTVVGATGSLFMLNLELFY